MYAAGSRGCLAVSGAPSSEALSGHYRTDRAWTAEGTHRAASVEQVLAEHESFWVIGGGAVYAAFLPHADRLVVTEIDLLVDGDTWAPRLGDEWQLDERTPAEGWETSSSGLRYAVSEYVRGTVRPAG